MGTKPEYARLQFQAPAWLEKYDPATQSMTLVATVPPGVKGSTKLDCALIALPITGTDPVQYTYNCLVENCDGECLLRWRQTIFGTVFWCECQTVSKTYARKAGKLAKGKPSGGARRASKLKRTPIKRRSAI